MWGYRVFRPVESAFDTFDILGETENNFLCLSCVKKIISINIGDNYVFKLSFIFV